MVLITGCNTDKYKLEWNIKEGSSVVEKLSKDLKKEFPDISGLSRTNLFAMRQFYLFYKDKSEFVPQLVGQIPWGHTRLIISKIKDIQEALYYSQQTIVNNWSRDILKMQIESKLYEREGKAVTNFKKTLPKPHSDLANQTLKDPYMFDFMMLKKDVQEYEIGLTKHITQFLLELGKGFAFIGRQYEITINKKNYRIDFFTSHQPARRQAVFVINNS